MVTVNAQVQQASTPVPFIEDEFIMFGDSITQRAWQTGGTGTFLADLYQRKLDIVNRGYSGYNTAWCLEVAKKLYPARAPKGYKFPKKRLVTIWLGANDAVLRNRPQHIDIDQFAANLKQLINIFRAHDAGTASGPPTQIILITPPPISVSLRAADLTSRFPDWKPTDMDREPGRTAACAERVKSVGAQEGLPVVDAWTAITIAAEHSDRGLADFLADGLHLAPAGYQIVSNELLALLQAQRPDLLPHNLPQHFPNWKDIDPDHPEKSFPATILHDEL
ncbi:hypothetical protein CROQUDRAFT_650270 [Cronartium quercuum f. sp. fusiforme G11]|uniref:SGNH hydrolase-type esterase domain-containing protein n=1 Tax=Cronartium quercuum f. sp. fusiforme G11 TaxID=708437 RepID=A0A9P6NZ90_9BASI|nr:hypothetical protein CROQUDRAFT_650270 [Cronartium quercuum f. sp. fusiforme G11]